jgi:hypothetical protein
MSENDDRSVSKVYNGPPWARRFFAFFGIKSAERKRRERAARDADDG